MPRLSFRLLLAGFLMLAMSGAAPIAPFLQAKKAERVFATAAFPYRPFLPDKARCAEGDTACARFVRSAAWGPYPGPTHITAGLVRRTSRFQAWRQARCLAFVAWSEARGDGADGMFAVINTVLNRVRNADYPDTACAVIAQTAQFSSMYAPGNRQWLAAARQRSRMVPDIPARHGPDRLAALQARRLAFLALRRLDIPDPTGGATYFITKALWRSPANPAWTARLRQTADIGGHVFFRQDG